MLVRYHRERNELGGFLFFVLLSLLLCCFAGSRIGVLSYGKFYLLCTRLPRAILPLTWQQLVGIRMNNQTSKASHRRNARRIL